MPIYAYKCESCGYVKDVLQKMSDPLLEVCPSCAQPTFRKQLTAAGFQLKGSGWYATDFKGSGAAPVVPPVSGKADAATPAAADAPKGDAATPTPAAVAAPTPAAPTAPTATGG